MSFASRKSIKETPSLSLSSARRNTIRDQRDINRKTAMETKVLESRIKVDVESAKESAKNNVLAMFEQLTELVKLVDQVPLDQHVERLIKPMYAVFENMDEYTVKLFCVSKALHYLFHLYVNRLDVQINVPIIGFIQKVLDLSDQANLDLLECSGIPLNMISSFFDRLVGEFNDTVQQAANQANDEKAFLEQKDAWDGDLFFSSQAMKSLLRLLDEEEISQKILRAISVDRLIPLFRRMTTQHLSASGLMGLFLMWIVYMEPNLQEQRLFIHHCCQMLFGDDSKQETISAALDILQTLCVLSESIEDEKLSYVYDVFQSKEVNARLVQLSFNELFPHSIHLLSYALYYANSEMINYILSLKLVDSLLAKFNYSSLSSFLIDSILQCLIYIVQSGNVSPFEQIISDKRFSLILSFISADYPEQVKTSAIRLVLYLVNICTNEQLTYLNVHHSITNKSTSYFVMVEEEELHVLILEGLKRSLKMSNCIQVNLSIVEHIQKNQNKYGPSVIIRCEDIVSGNFERRD